MEKLNNSQERQNMQKQVSCRFGEFLFMSPAALLSPAELIAGGAVVIGGFQNLFRTLYGIMPVEIKAAWNAVDTLDFLRDPREAERQARAYGAAKTIKRLVAGIHLHLTQKLLKATAEVWKTYGYGPQFAYDPSDLCMIIKLNSWFDPLLAAANDVKSIQKSFEQYIDYLTKFFSGLALIRRNYEDIHYGEMERLHGEMVKRAIVDRGESGELLKKLRDRKQSLKEQLEFVMESILSLDGPQYADAMYQSGRLLIDYFKAGVEFTAAVAVYRRKQ